MALPAGHWDAWSLASGDRNIVLELAIQIDIRQSIPAEALAHGEAVAIPQRILEFIC